jgi:signal transduction histidine kinase
MNPSETATEFAPVRGVALESVLCTEELSRRPSRPPDYQTESRVLLTLAQHLADSPRTILQRLVEVALEVCQAGSAGVSLISEESGNFYWPAIAGAWKPHIGGGTPRDFGPCGVVLERDAAQLFRHPERYYPYLVPASPIITEVLLSPFHVKGRALGTVWVVSHEEGREFDAEDLRLVESISRFAAAAYTVWVALDAGERQARTLREVNEALLVSSVRQHELTEQTQEQAAALSDLHRRKDEFLAMLSHELRNPLAPLANAVQLLRLQRGSENPIEQQARTIIERQVGQLRRLVDDLLEVSRITTGRVQLRRERVAVSGIVERAVETARPLIQQRWHELSVSLPPGPIWLHADAARLEQVVVNLLTNAAKYTDEGGHIWLNQRAGSVSDRRNVCCACGIQASASPPNSYGASSIFSRRQNGPWTAQKAAWASACAWCNVWWNCTAERSRLSVH